MCLSRCVYLQELSSLLLSWACPSLSGGSLGDPFPKRGLGIYLREGRQLH